MYKIRVTKKIGTCLFSNLNLFGYREARCSMTRQVAACQIWVGRGSTNDPFCLPERFGMALPSIGDAPALPSRSPSVPRLNAVVLGHIGSSNNNVTPRYLGRWQTFKQRLGSASALHSNPIATPIPARKPMAVREPRPTKICPSHAIVSYLPALFVICHSPGPLLFCY